ncbi:MAG: ATP phosphoribosyltransferase [Hyphomicrobiaceae bacterium]|nr:ATP phosphoribosyltransferase [Hyphomicrobiaceae bacterium]
MSDKLVMGIPSKGRLMEATAKILAEAGLELRKVGHERGYRGEIVGLDNVDVAFISASEIANALRTGLVHMGVTGEDLIREEITDAEDRIDFIKKLGFGHADVVVAVPQCWVDVRRMSDLDAVASRFRRTHQRRLRVATKYMNLTRRYFAACGIADYWIIESLGATEGTPAAGTADLIVDITSSGETLRANGLKVLDDGIILKSEANLLASKTINWSPDARAAENEILSRLGI